MSASLHLKIYISKRQPHLVHNKDMAQWNTEQRAAKSLQNHRCRRRCRNSCNPWIWLFQVALILFSLDSRSHYRLQGCACALLNPRPSLACFFICCVCFLFFSLTCCDLIIIHRTCRRTWHCASHFNDDDCATYTHRRSHETRSPRFSLFFIPHFTWTKYWKSLHWHCVYGIETIFKAIPWKRMHTRVHTPATFNPNKRS